MLITLLPPAQAPALGETGGQMLSTDEMTSIQALAWFSIVVKLLARASCASAEALQARVLASIKYFNATWLDFKWT